MNDARSNNDGAMLWRYVAVDAARVQRAGEFVGATAADVRASLRRIGLQVIDVRPLRRKRKGQTLSPSSAFGGVMTDVVDWWRKRCRRGRGRSAQRAEIYDSLATMLASGLPLVEAVQTLTESRDQNDSGIGGGQGPRAMLVEIRERLRGGDSLASAMREHPGWFDPIDIAMVEAGQHGGTLSTVLQGLAERQERSSELSHKLLGALAYPMLVMLVGLGVVVFLSVKTLPDLTKILVDAKIPIPALTAKVMWLGQGLAAHWPSMMLAIIAGVIAASVLPRSIQRLGRASELPAWFKHVRGRLQPPRVIRQMLVGGLVMGLANLLRSGVPIVEALRVLAPAQRSRRLRAHLVEAAQRIERGDELSEALSDSAGGRGRGWFDLELQRLLDVGQASGELDVMLTRIGERYQRRARRLIDRLTALLEPAVLLLLALLVGTVVMAAILPLLSLQEII